MNRPLAGLAWAVREGRWCAVGGGRLSPGGPGGGGGGGAGRGCRRRGRRYETASALTADVDRYLADEPVAAGPLSAAYRARKFVRRNRGTAAVAAAAAVVVVALVGGIVGTTWQAARANAEAGRANAERGVADAERGREGAREGEAVAARRRAEALLGDLDAAARQLRDRQDLLYRTLIRLVRANVEEREIEPAARRLAECAPELRGWKWGHLNRAAHPVVATLKGDCVAFMPGGRELVVGDDAGVRRVEFLTGRLLHTYGANRPERIVVAPDGRHVAVIERPPAVSGDSKLKVFRAADATPLVEADDVDDVAFSPDGKRVGAVGGRLAVWDLDAPPNSRSVSVPSAGPPSNRGPARPGSASSPPAESSSCCRPVACRRGIPTTCGGGRRPRRRSRARIFGRSPRTAGLWRSPTTRCASSRRRAAPGSPWSWRARPRSAGASR